jgi:hypothetical protein
MRERKVGKMSLKSSFFYEGVERFSFEFPMDFPLIEREFERVRGRESQNAFTKSESSHGVRGFFMEKVLLRLICEH